MIARGRKAFDWFWGIVVAIPLVALGFYQGLFPGMVAIFIAVGGLLVSRRFRQ